MNNQYLLALLLSILSLHVNAQIEVRTLEQAPPMETGNWPIDSTVKFSNQGPKGQVFSLPPMNKSWHPVGGTGNNRIVGQVVRAIAVAPNGDIYIAGVFDSPYKNIAKWNGVSWETLGNGIQGTVYDMKFGPDGNLYVSGDISANGQMPETKYILKWDGYQWSNALGGHLISIGGTIYALAFDSTGNLYVAGSSLSTESNGFLSNGIAKWDGTTFKSVCSANGAVRALMFGNGGKLYAGGEFTQIASVACNRIASFDGNSWSKLGTGATGSVYCMTQVGDDLIIGGAFNIFGSTPARNVARWNGTAWSAIGAGLTGKVQTLQADSDGTLWAGGSFLKSGTADVKNLACWNGTNWLNKGADSTVWVIRTAGNGNLLVGGYFRSINQQQTPQLAKLTNNNWSTFGAGISICCDFDALAISPSNEVVIGGVLETAGTINIDGQNVAKWNGTSWAPLGNGLNGLVKTLEYDPGGTLYAGGGFSKSGTVSTPNIARWDGTAWSKLGSGPDGPVLGITFGSDNTLYAGGFFSKCGTVTTSNIARWDGAQWTALGTGTNKPVQALTKGPDGIYAIGSFTSPFQYIAKWDGASWQGVGNAQSPDGFVRCMQFDGTGKLYAGGNFTHFGNQSCNHVAVYNGIEWTNLGDGVPGVAYSIQTDNQNRVYVAYSHTGEQGGNGVAMWDGTAWFDLIAPDSTNQYINSLKFDHAGKLYAAGLFAKPYAHLMVWDVCSDAVSVSLPTIDRGECDTTLQLLAPDICGGTPPYQFHWSTGETTNFLKVAPAFSKSYCVTVTDVFGSKASACTTVKVNPFYCMDKMDYLMVDSVGEHWIAFSWKMTSDSTPFALIYLTNNTTYSYKSFLVKGNLSHFIADSLDCGTSYELLVIPGCDCNNRKKYSGYNMQLDTATLACTVSAHIATGPAFDISLSPQPASNILHVQTPGMNDRGSLEIFDTQGRLVYEQARYQSYASLDLSAFSSGVYVVMIKTDAGVRVKRFLKH